VVVRAKTHFENPNYDWPESVTYDYVGRGQNPANYVGSPMLIFLQDATATDRGIPARPERRPTVYLSQIRMFTPDGSPLRLLWDAEQNAVASKDARGLTIGVAI